MELKCWSNLELFLQLWIVLFCCKSRAFGEDYNYDYDNIIMPELFGPVLPPTQKPEFKLLSPKEPKIPSPIEGSLDCGRTRDDKPSRFIGYVDNDFPMIAALAIIRNNTSLRFCQGTIIGTEHILTSLQCSHFSLETYVVLGPYEKSSKGVGLFHYPIMEHNIRNHKEGTLIKCSELYVMRPTVFDSNRSNIPCLFVLEQAIPFTRPSQVGPACLPVQNSVQDTCKSDLFMIGWEDYREDLSMFSKSAFTVLPDNKCAVKVGNYSNQMCMLSGDKNLIATSNAAGVYCIGSDDRFYIVGLVDKKSPRHQATWTALNVLSVMQWIVEKASAN